MKSYPYTVIRSSRRTLALTINGEGLQVRAPYTATAAAIERFVLQHRSWIEKHLGDLRRQQEAAESAGLLTDRELQELARRARERIPERVRHYAPLVGVTYGRITVRAQRTRWGSCSAKGNLNFNCLLMLAPPEVLDSVVVHELCHRRHMNHSDAFYRDVLRVFPEYRRWNKWLTRNGRTLMARLPGKNSS